MEHINLVYPMNNIQEYRMLVWCWSINLGYTHTKMELENEFGITIDELPHQLFYTYMDGLADVVNSAYK